LATYTQIIYHIVFATKHRERVLDKPRRDDLFRYIWGIIKNHEGHVFRLNGVEDHIHILTSLHPTVGLAELVKSIKTGSAKWIKENGVFPQFSHWQEGYGVHPFGAGKGGVDRIHQKPGGTSPAGGLFG
jgi:putative transposase